MKIFENFDKNQEFLDNFNWFKGSLFLLIQLQADSPINRRLSFPNFHFNRFLFFLLFFAFLLEMVLILFLRILHPWWFIILHISSWFPLKSRINFIKNRPRSLILSYFFTDFKEGNESSRFIGNFSGFKCSLTFNLVLNMQITLPPAAFIKSIARLLASVTSKFNGISTFSIP